MPWCDATNPSRVHAIPGGAELVGGKQAHDGRDITGFRPAQDHRGAAELNGRQIIHRPSLRPRGTDEPRPPESFAYASPDLRRLGSGRYAPRHDHWEDKEQ